VSILISFFISMKLVILRRMRLTIALILFNISLSFADNTFVLTDKDYEVLNLDIASRYLEFYKDPGNLLTINDLKGKKFEKVTPSFSANFDRESTYWFRFSIQNRSHFKLWFFEVLDPHIHYLNSYQITGADTVHFKPTGFRVNFFDRPSNHKNFVFPVKFYNSDETQFYFSFKNTFPSYSFSIRPAEQFIDYALNEYYLLGIFYGILFIMAIYNLFIYISTRETVYLYYVAYVLCYCLNSFEEDGLGFQFVWSNLSWINQFLEIFAPLLLIISFVFYSKKFLFLKSYATVLNTWINISLFIYCLLHFLNYFIFSSSWTGYFYIFPFALIFIAGMLAWKRGNLSAKYFLLAFSFLAFCFTVFFLRIMNIVPTTIYTVYALNFGFLIEVVLFSYALGQRLRIEKEEKTKIDSMLILQLRENEKLKDSITKDLEEKVKERTKEVSAKNRQLDQALTELKTKSDQIEELNKLLEQDNKALNQDIKDITKARFMLKDLTLDEFQKIYPDELSCFKYLSDIKWAKSYHCKKCGNKNASEGKTEFSKRCTKCGYDESVTAFTIFHKSKLPITTTFYLIYLVMANKEISSHDLSNKLGLRQKTCWAFKKKVIDAIDKNGSAKFTSKEWGRIFYS
jgi:two-component system, sensor histidine kinase LadS